MSATKSQPLDHQELVPLSLLTLQVGKLASTGKAGNLTTVSAEVQGPRTNPDHPF